MTTTRLRDVGCRRLLSALSSTGALALLLLCVLFPVDVLSRSSGAPQSACHAMTPKHGVIEASSSPSPYYLVLEKTNTTSGEWIRLKVMGRGDERVKGFIAQARSTADPDGAPVGTFSEEGNNKLVECQGAHVITHSQPLDNAVVDLDWKAASDFEGDVIFRASVVKNYKTFWVNFDSEKVSVKKRSTSPLAGDDATVSKDVTTEAQPTPRSGAVSSLDNLYDDCGLYKTCFGIPSGCTEKKNCDFMTSFTAAADGRYEFELRGKGGNEKFVAVGLSFDEFMGDDSVVSCTSENGVTDAFLSYNEGRQNKKVRDPKDGIQLVKAIDEDGVLYCRFLRRKVTKVFGKTYDLENVKYHILVSAGRYHDGFLQYHEGNRAVTTQPLAVGQTSEAMSGSNSRLMIILHASLMVFAWVCCASSGILFARYFKRTWLRFRRCDIDQWFHCHRFFMTLTWGVTISAFVIIVYHLKHFDVHYHSIIGVCSVALCFIQPFMAAIRPAPSAERRNLFNWAHWLVGNAAHILGISAIFFGYELFLGASRNWVKEVAWYTLIAFIAFHCLTHLLLSIAQCITDRQPKPSDVFPMKEIAGSRTLLQPEQARTDAPGGCFRKFILALYLPVNWFATALLIIMIVFSRSEIEDQLTKWNVQPFWDNI